MHCFQGQDTRWPYTCIDQHWLILQMKWNIVGMLDMQSFACNNWGYMSIQRLLLLMLKMQGMRS